MNGDNPILLPGPGDDDEPPETPPPVEEVAVGDDSIPLAPPKMWTRGFLIICGVVAAVLFLLLREITTTLEMTLPTSAWLVPVGVVLILITIRRLLLPRAPRTIDFGPESVELPRSRNSRRTSTIRYDELRTIVPLVSRGQPALVIDGQKRTQIYVASDFPHPELWRLLWAQLIDRIASLPDGFDQIRQMRRLAGLSQESSAIKGRFTRKLFWLIAAIFAAQLFLAPPVSVLEYLYFGANSRVMVLQEGQLWRIVTANLLHGGGVHFAVNAFALYFLGTYCERLFGEPRTIVLTLGTALAGATASLVGTEAMFAVGISTALFGLLGAYFALHLRFGRQLPPPYRQTRLWWGVILGLNLVLSVAIPIIDAWGHFGGFAAGVLLGWLMTGGQEQFRPRPDSSRWTSVVAAGLVALFAASSIIAIGYALGDHPEDEIAVAQDLLDRAEHEEPMRLVQVAYEWSDHQPRPPEIDTILVALAEAGFRNSDDIFVQWRAAAAIVTIGEQLADPFDIELMARGVERFEQMARFHDDDEARRVTAALLHDYTSHAGPLHAAPSPFEKAHFDDRDIALDPAGPLDEARWVYLLAGPEEARPVAMLRRCLPASDAPGAAHPIEGTIDARLELRLAMVSTADECSPADRESWRTSRVER